MNKNRNIYEKFNVKCIIGNNDFILGGIQMKELAFKKGKFKIMLISDVQDKYPMDERTVKCMEHILDAEQPDFVFLNGDNCNGQVVSKEYFEQYVTQLTKPIEDREILWAHVFGNHDDEFIKSPEFGKEFQQSVYESMPHCLSQRGDENLPGIGNYRLPVYSNKNHKEVFNIWALDSLTYIEKTNPGARLKESYTVLENGQSGSTNYDFIKFKQIQWYHNLSEALEKKHGEKIPGLMFFHMALPEHRLVPTNPMQTKMVGERNEEICNSPINSGLFSTILERGDIKGIFVGHDHINDFVGNVYGVMLGFDGAIGYNHYGLESEDPREKHRIRGARIFTINEDNPWDIKTYMRYGVEFGIW